MQLGINGNHRLESGTEYTAPAAQLRLPKLPSSMPAPLWSTGSCAQHPLSPANAWAFRHAWFCAAAAALGGLTGTTERGGAAKRLAQDLAARADHAAAAYADPGSVSTPIARILGAKDELTHLLTKEIAAATGRDEQAVGRELKAQFLSLIESSWQQIDRSISDRRMPACSYSATLTPLSARSSGSLQETATGRVSFAVPANFWLSSYADPAGKVLFSGYRSGAFSQYLITDPAVRARYSRLMVHHAVSTIARHSFSCLAPAEQEDYIAARKTFELKLLSLDLQSRGLQSSEDTNPQAETIALRESSAALRALDANSLPVTLPNGQVISVRFRIVAFNYPVEHHAFLCGTGWGSDTDVHNGSLGTFLAETSQWLADPTHRHDQTRYAKVALLFSQIQEIHSLGLARVADYDPYKMNSRLANLAFLTGWVPLWNCRSGKDRTGMLDAEAKLLAHQLELHAAGDEDFPAPDYQRRLSQAEGEVLQQLLFRGGNMDILQYNTGVPGFKLRETTSDPRHCPLRQRIGTEAWEAFKGMSNVARS